MSRKMISTSLLFLFSISLISSYIMLGSAATGDWNNIEIISNNLGNSPEIDGKKENLWTNEVNSSDCNWDTAVKLSVQHFGGYIYFLIEAKFGTSQTSEIMSVYLANSNETTDIFDKKEIIMNKANEKGNETSIFSDYYYDTEAEQYVLDSSQEASSFEGAAKYSNSSDSFRFYEFKIQMAPTNDSQDSEILGTHNYAVQVGLDYPDDSKPELVSNTLLVQIGKPLDIENTEIYEDETFDVQLYILIVMISVSSIFVLYGIALISSKSKVGQIRMEDE